MAAASTIIAAVGVAVAAAGTAYTIKSSQDQAAEAKEQAKKQDAHQNKLLEEAKRQTDAMTSEEPVQQAQNQARDRQRALAQGAGGRKSTILTSPLGLTGDAQSPSAAGGKTLLGS
jgi:hypothetical protein